MGRTSRTPSLAALLAPDQRMPVSRRMLMATSGYRSLSTVRITVSSMLLLSHSLSLTSFPSLSRSADPVQPASNVGNALYGTTSKSESAIWTFDRMTRRLRPTWVNSDSQQVETFIVKRESGRELLLTADPDRLQQKSGTCWVMVRLTRLSYVESYELTLPSVPEV
jgi:hypothetical protein